MALQDPYCAWDKVQGKCRSHGAGRWGEESFFYQSVSTGTHSACPPSKMGKDAGSVGGLSDRSTQPKFNQDHQSVKDRPDGQVINIVHENKEYENSGKLSGTVQVLCFICGFMVEMVVGDSEPS